MISNSDMRRSPSVILKESRNAMVGSSKLTIFSAATVQAPMVIALAQLLSRIRTAVRRMMIQTVNRLTVTVIK